MYTKEQLQETFKPYIKNQDYFNDYVEIYQFYKTNETQNKKYNFHHCIPVNYTKEKLQEKNRYHSIEEHDKIYDIEDNIVKLPIHFHIIAHYCLAKATLREDDINSFFTLINDYSQQLDYYNIDNVSVLALAIEENALETKQERYMTLSEIKENNKQIREESKKQWEEEHKEEIELKNKINKEKQEENKKQWIEEHKEEIELNNKINKEKREEKQKEWEEKHKEQINDYKEKQKQFRKEQYKKQKEWIKNNRKV